MSSPGKQTHYDHTAHGGSSRCRGADARTAAEARRTSSGAVLLELLARRAIVHWSSRSRWPSNGMVGGRHIGYGITGQGLCWAGHRDVDPPAGIILIVSDRIRRHGLIGDGSWAVLSCFRVCVVWPV
jgi:hypothetical protein